jgi:calcineurin-like phosphoesterase family protein
MHFGTWHVFGHSHGNHITSKNRLSMEVGIDCHKNMEPFSYDEIKQYMLNNKNVDIETGQLLPIMKRIGNWFNNY